MHALLANITKILMIFLFLFTQQAYAENSGPEFNAANIQQALRTLDTLASHFKNSPAAANAINSNDITSLINNPQNQAQAITLLKQNGYNNPQDWSVIIQRTLAAYGAYQLKGQQKTVDAQMQNILQQMQQNPAVTAEQRTQMQATLQNAQQALANASDADIKTITPLIKDIETTMAKHSDYLPGL
ncbi:MAG: hypothetical protein H0W44_01355 [Gammaproteobacteria bacterium]|nr:hypothetical protein [Gammaproteobacteria bacterium]